MSSKAPARLEPSLFNKLIQGVRGTCLSQQDLVGPVFAQLIGIASSFSGHGSLQPNVVLRSGPAGTDTAIKNSESVGKDISTQKSALNHNRRARTRPAPGVKTRKKQVTANCESEVSL